MFKIIIGLLSLGLISELSAIDVNIEFYEAGHVPADYLEDPGFPCTVATFVGLPANRTLDLYLGRRENTKDYKMQKIGDLSADRGKDFLGISAIGFLPGELVKYELKDGKETCKEIFLIPYPIYAISSQDNAIVKAIIEERSPVNYSISFEGFEENEKVKFKSYCYDECLESDLVINQNLITMLLPEVIGKMGGVAKVNIIRSTGEVLEIKLPWGLEWLKYCYFYDKGKARTLVDDPLLKKECPAIYEYFRSQKN